MILQGKPMEPGSGHRDGRQLLAQMYLQTVGEPMPEILVTDRGKPYFANSPWHFSISHSKGHVFCALSEHPIGIDAEELDREIRPEPADKILSPMEWQQYDAAEDPQKVLLTFWVLKEARAKFTGVGLQGYPNHTEFLLTDPRVRQLLNCLVTVIEEEDYVI